MRKIFRKRGFFFSTWVFRKAFEKEDCLPKCTLRGFGISGKRCPPKIERPFYFGGPFLRWLYFGRQWQHSPRFGRSLTCVEEGIISTEELVVLAVAEAPFSSSGCGVRPFLHVVRRENLTFDNWIVMMSNTWHFLKGSLIASFLRSDD
ncbi:hypothetical protein CEXT_297361 [Caerostris extrusa]|uniref:Uncharacterized protein n=1 Tax=Caerostris extrusa TaxID=172846 RepID=A0AAV4MEL8_CAEEX|nr:hypothetical protein CEXT_297361 [Caerostris extrusa]